MADSKRKTAIDIEALAPLAAFVLGLLFVWTVSVFALRQLELQENWPRQVYPILLWIGAIALFVRWQKVRRPAEWLGLVPLGKRALGFAAAGFLIVFAWNAIRVGLSRMPGEMLGQIPPEIYVWLIAGVLVNEALFRGLVQTRLTEIVGPAIAIPAAALLAVVFRIPAYFTTALPIPFDPVALVNVFLIGLVAGALRYYGRSLWPAIAVGWANSLGALL